MKWRLVLFILLLTYNAWSQQLPPFLPLRYDEDYSALKNDSTPDFYRKLKYRALSADGNTYISLGGEARLQYLYYKNDLWSDAPADTHRDVLSRYLLHGDFHAGKHFRAFAQLQSSLAIKKGAAPVDDNSLELHQGFVEVNTMPDGKMKLTARIGRQEFSYGSQRLVSVREGPNNRQSFDALKLIFEHKDLSTDVFYSYYVMSRNGFFNDNPSDNTRFWGIYIVKKHVPILYNVDLYYLGLLKRHAAFDDGSGKEIRHTVGTRIWENAGDLKYDFEAVYQFGKLEEKEIRAWTASLSGSYTFSQEKLKPRIGLKTELISGDSKYDDNKLQTFNPLFPRGGYFGLAALIGPENLIGLHPSFSVTAFQVLNISADYDRMWRYSINDGIYAPSNMLIYTGRNAAEKLIGNQYSLILDYPLNRCISFSSVFTWFNAGDYLKIASPGKDVFFIGLSTQAKF